MVVSRIEQYLSEIQKTNADWGLDNATTHCWYRGQGDENWQLEPSIYRNGGNNDYERELIRDFKLNSIRFLDSIPNIDLEWLFVMQHYGISTRLLDWTESHLTALYFAVLNYKNTNNSAVWILDGWSLNEYVFGDYTIPISDHPALTNHCLNNTKDLINRVVNARLPVAVRPSRITARITAQKGTFTIHGNDSRALNEIIDELNTEKDPSDNKDEIRYKKIIIDGGSKKNILQNLMQAGISHSVLFPELEGLSKEINFRYSYDYMGNSGHMHNGF